MAPDRFRLTLVVAALLAAHVGAALADLSGLSWGWDMLRYGPTWLTAAFAASSALLLILTLRASASPADVVAPARVDLWSPSLAAWMTRIAILVAGGLGFWVLQSAVHLLGDGYLVLRGLSLQQRQFGNAPFAFWLVRAAYSWLGPLGVGPEAVYRHFSYLSGVAYMGLAHALAGYLGQGPRQRLILFGMLVTPGFMQLFFGYVENYPLLFPSVLLYLLCGVAYLRRRAPLVAGAASAAVLCCSHVLLMALIPSLLALPALRELSRDRDLHPGGGRRLPTPRQVAGTLASLMAGVALYEGLLAAIGYRGDRRLPAELSHLVLPIWGDPTEHQAYRILSFAHLMDFLNQQLLASPAVLLAVLGARGWSGRGHRSEQAFLLTAGLCLLAATFVVNPEIGFFRDWDALALPALPLTAWVGLVVADSVQTNRDAAVAGALLCGASALHTLAWVVVNASSDAAVARYTHLMDTGALSAHARSYGWEVLGAYHRDRGDPASAVRAYRGAAAAAPENWRHWAAVAEQCRELGRTAEAVEAYERMLELGGALPADRWDYLGTAYRDLGRYEESVRASIKALELEPERQHLWYNLGNALLLGGRSQEAMAAYQAALASDGPSPELHLNMGLSYEAAGDLSQAIASYRAALAMDGNHSMAHYRLALLYGRAQDHSAAREHAGRYLHLQRDSSHRSAEMRALLR